MVARYLPGDIVARRKGLVMHRGIALGGDRILHNTPLRGEHVSTEAEFRQGQPMHVRHTERIKRLRTLHAAQDAAQGQPRRGYNLFTNNCEHTVTRAATGKAQSPQLISWSAGIGIGALAFALTRHPAAAAAGFALGKRLVKGDDIL